jgi:hypothetical protein
VVFVFFVVDVCSSKKSRNLENIQPSHHKLLEYAFFQWNFQLFGLRHRQTKFVAKSLKKILLLIIIHPKKSRKLDGKPSKEATIRLKTLLKLAFSQGQFLLSELNHRQHHV